MPIGDSTAKVTGAAPKKRAATASPAKTTQRNSNRMEYDVRGKAQGIVTLEGVIDAIQGGTLRLRHKRPASSKYALTPIPISRVLVLRGDAKVGKFVRVTYESAEMVFLRLRRADLNGFDEALGMNIGTDENGKTFYIRPENCHATTTSEVTAPTTAAEKF